MNINHDREDLNKIVAQFVLQGEPKAFSAFGSGLINDTYRILNASKAGPDYVLQKINHSIFKDVPALIDNILSVTAHLRSKLMRVSETERNKRVLCLVPTKVGNYYFKDKFENFWRMYRLIAGTRSYDFAESERQVYEGGAAFGFFHAKLADLDTSLITDSIPNFHNIERRLSDLHQAIEKDAAGRVQACEQEIEFIELRKSEMAQILKMGRLGKLPERVIHGDTKFNNLLFDEQDKAQCVIDLDTVMVGYIAYDFGDAIRTIINTASEDERDLDRIQLNIGKFEAFTRGYLSQTISFITKEEVSTLVMAVILLPYMQAVRFLTDYLNGDVYYKASFEMHNLQRMRAQLQLVRMLEASQNELMKIVDDVFIAAKSESNMKD